MEPGQRVGADFRLVAPLGDHVYEAERISTGERLAIRFAPSDVRDDPRERARFAERAARAQAIDSERVVEIVGFGVSAEGLPYLVMEWLDGEPLADRLAREERLGRSTLVAVLRQLAEALDAAHARGVVHGAVDPRRLFLVTGPERGVKLLDLGALRSTGRDEGYARPRGRRDVQEGVEDDRWAVAAIAYRALTGRRPFAGREAAAAARFVAPSELSPSLSRAVDRWFARAFGRGDSGRRDGGGFATTMAMVEDFERALRAPATPPVPRAVAALEAFLLVATAVAAVLAGAAVAALDGF